ncbi:MAG TPA: ABC transporter substrate-binding protein [Gemmataceae bacterium]|nr:ABC transporter substrate-binding protein [Gemmataceae bacterium]
MRAWRLLSLLLPLIAFGCSTKAAPEPLWIGQLLPLEGPNRTIGQHARQGVEQAVAESRAAEQTVAGHPLAVLHVDSRGDPATVQAETVRLLTVNRASALMADFDATLTERLLRENHSYGVPVVVPGALPGAADAKAVVSLGVPPAVRGRLLAQYASVDLHLHRAAVLTDSRHPIASALAAAFIKAWPRKGDSSIEEWTYTTVAERDERITRLIQAAPTVVLLACPLSDLRALRPRLATALPKAPLLHGGEDGGVSPLQAELETHADIYLATAYSADHLTESGRDFARRYEERFHESPDLYAAQTYDATRLLFDAMQRAGNASKEALVKEISHLEQFDSVTGPVRWKDRQPRRRVFLIALKNNRAKVVRTIEPDDN